MGFNWLILKNKCVLMADSGRLRVRFESDGLVSRERRIGRPLCARLKWSRLFKQCQTVNELNDFSGPTQID